MDGPSGIIDSRSAPTARSTAIGFSRSRSPQRSRQNLDLPETAPLDGRITWQTGLPATPVRDRIIRSPSRPARRGSAPLALLRICIRVRRCRAAADQGFPLVVRPADNRSAIRTDAAGPVNAFSASHGGFAVHGCLSNNCGSVRSRTAGPIYTIGAYNGMGRARWDNSAKHYQGKPGDFPHFYLQARERDYAFAITPHKQIIAAGAIRIISPGPGSAAPYALPMRGRAVACRPICGPGGGPDDRRELSSNVISRESAAAGARARPRSGPGPGQARPRSVPGYRKAVGCAH